MTVKNQVLVVDDEVDIRELLSMTLTGMGLEPHCAATTRGRTTCWRKTVTIFASPTRLPDGDGLYVVDHVMASTRAFRWLCHRHWQHRKRSGRSEELGHSTISQARIAQSTARSGALRALKLPQPNQGRRSNEAQERSGAPVLIGTSPLMQATRDMIEKLARSQAPVHVTGESGCG
jgi:two-component system response regulator PilR (NtrC family)